MTSKCEIIYPTGLFIPLEKQSIFMVAFNGMLESAYNIKPVFGPVTWEDFCEVKFDYLGNKSYKPGSFLADLEKALAFLKENMSVLGPTFPRKGRKSRFQTPPQVINLADESEVKTVDLTDFNQSQPEIIVLEDSFIRPHRKTGLSSNEGSVVDLTDINESLTSPGRSKNIEHKILNVKTVKPQISPFRNTPGIGAKRLNSSNKKTKCKKGMKKCKNGKTNNGRSPSVTVSNLSTMSRSSTSLSSNHSLPRKKRKLQDISNIHSTQASSSKPVTSVQPSESSDIVLKYYKNISNVVGKAEQGKKKTPIRNSSTVSNHLVNNSKRKRESPTRKYSPLIINVEANRKRKIFTPQNRIRQLNNLKISSNSARRLRRIRQQNLRNAGRRLEETNAFNPNPLEVDLEGLRPIVIDGCNVAIGHGRGKFSARGLQICVDYFATRGHATIKVFLPQFRQQEFSPEQLEALRAKSDVVFTPSLSINGQRRTPYDDRFIVQYATEFGGVIVSTDNYRDLLRENPRWQDTIEKRLLMFTWVDDFLMFPVDPLGRQGPTLEELLRF